MLIDLYILKTYFEDSFSVVYEEDLVERYGREETSRAIHDGDLDHRWIPCKNGKKRCVCRLSDQAIQKLSQNKCR